MKMKNKPYTRYILIQLLIGLMTIISIFIYWFVYIFRKEIRKKRDVIACLFWLFLNDNKNEPHNDEGADWWFIEKGMKPITEQDNFFKRLFYAYKWSVFRNGVWNLVTQFTQEDGEVITLKEIENKPNKYSVYTWRNYKYIGKQYVKYKINDVKYFRYSFSNEIWFFGKRLWNVMLGYDKYRLVMKFRMPLLKNVR